MTTRDIRAHLREMYGVEVSPDLISRVTGAVIEELAEWQARPLDRAWFLPMVANPDGEGFACRDTRPTRCRLMLSAATSS